MLPAHFAPETCGLIVPKTKDGRVVFLLPWLGGVLAGTTDAPAPVTLAPRPSAEEVGFILEAVAPYLAAPASEGGRAERVVGDPAARDAAPRKRRRKGHRARFARPRRGGRATTSAVTVTGGKWTTRLMAEHAVDAAVRVAAKADASVAARAGPCVTDAVAVLGAHGHRAGLAQTILMENARGVLEDSNANAFARRKRKTRGGEARALDDPRRRGRRSNTWSARTATARVASWTWRVQTTRSRSRWRRRECDARRRGGVRGAGEYAGRRATFWRAAARLARAGRAGRRSRRARGERGARERTRMGLVQGGEGSCGRRGRSTYVSVLTRIPDAEHGLMRY